MVGLKGSLIRTIGILWLAFWMPSGLVLAGSDYSLSEAIDDAGRQRMLTQRMLKAYSQIGLGVQPQQGKVELEDAVALFDTQYMRLQQWRHEADIAEQLQRVDRIWQVYKQHVLGKVNAPEAQKLLSISESLLSESQRLVLRLEQLAGTQTAELINLSGRQRMLSQRLAKYYLLGSWGIETPAMSEKMDQVRLEFDSALKVLHTQTFNNLEIADRLAQIESDWTWFNNAMQHRHANRYNLVVVDASEKLLQQLEQLTRLYVAEGMAAEGIKASRS